jgi:mono/diheme cytochrome c family protein
MRISHVGLAFLAVACASAPDATDTQTRTSAAPSPEIEAGRVMAEAQCGACHAVGASGESRVPPAPAFRRLAAQYPGDQLRVIFAEGIATGHPSMPRWIFTDREVNQLLAYVRSLPGDDSGG